MQLWNTFHKREHVRVGCEKTLSDLGLDYVDLYLVHFPISLKFVPVDVRYPPGWVHDPAAAQPKMELSDATTRETWEGTPCRVLRRCDARPSHAPAAAAMEELVDAGLVRNIGVSNFSCQSLQDMFKYARIAPAVNQIELHPYLVQPHLVRYCQEHNVAVTAYSPLGSGSYVELGGATEQETVLRDPVIAAIAAARGKTPAQVVLRWAVQRNTIVIPKSSKHARIVENISIADFALSDEEMALISSLDKHRRYNDPAVFCEGAFGLYYPIRT